MTTITKQPAVQSDKKGYFIRFDDAVAAYAALRAINNAELIAELDRVIEASSVEIAGKKRYPPECMQNGRVLLDALAQAKAKRDALAN